MRILLISGHGDGDPGASGNGYKEADLTRELAKLIQSYLSKYATVDIADTSKNWYKHIIKQGNYFNFKPYKYVLELHFNASSKEVTSDGKTKGTEIYVTKSEKSTNLEAKILKGITSIGFRDRGIIPKNFDLIKYVKNQGVSAALLEVCFIDDIDDMKLYISKKNEIAAAIAKGIAEGFGLSAPVENKKEGEEMTEADVIAIIKKYEQEKAKENASTWFKEAFDKASDAGVLDGSAPKGTVTREMLAEILNRLNLLDK